MRIVILATSTGARGAQAGDPPLPMLRRQRWGRHFLPQVVGRHFRFAIWSRSESERATDTQSTRTGSSAADTPHGSCSGVRGAPAAARASSISMTTAGCYVTIFAGPGAQRRAQNYADALRAGVLKPLGRRFAASHLRGESGAAVTPCCRCFRSMAFYVGRVSRVWEKAARVGAVRGHDCR